MAQGMVTGTREKETLKRRMHMMNLFETIQEFRKLMLLIAGGVVLEFVLREVFMVSFSWLDALLP